MDIKLKKLETADEYVDFVRAFVTLLDAEMTKWEKIATEDGGLNELARKMPTLIALADTAGYLRGQDNAFLDIRPSAPDNQGEFYQYENKFEERMNRLISMLLVSDQKQQYIDMLDRYFIKARTNDILSV